jgi:hypothetical protein
MKTKKFVVERSAQEYEYKGDSGIRTFGLKETPPGFV